MRKARLIQPGLRNKTEPQPPARPTARPTSVASTSPTSKPPACTANGRSDVSVIPGDTFGVEGRCVLRVSYGALERETAAEGIGRLVRGLRSLVR